MQRKGVDLSEATAILTDWVGIAGVMTNSMPY